MAQRVTPVDESRKDEDGVTEAVTVIMGQSHSTYWKVEFVDDVDVRVTDDVQTVRFAFPEEAPLYGDADDDKKVTGTKWVVNHREVDLGKANRDRLAKALAPFVNRAREIPAPPVVQRSTTSSTRRAVPNPDQPSAERVREWAKSIDLDVSDRGRVPSTLVGSYIKANPNWKSEQ
jgi:hypothetical protein